jgi:hypothetical protein
MNRPFIEGSRQGLQRVRSSSRRFGRPSPIGRRAKEFPHKGSSHRFNCLNPIGGVLKSSHEQESSRRFNFVPVPTCTCDQVREDVSAAVPALRSLLRPDRAGAGGRGSAHQSDSQRCATICAKISAMSQRSTSLGSPLITSNAVFSPSRQKRMSSLCLPMRRSRMVRSGSQAGRDGST